MVILMKTRETKKSFHVGGMKGDIALSLRYWLSQGPEMVSDGIRGEAQYSVFSQRM